MIKLFAPASRSIGLKVLLTALPDYRTAASVLDDETFGHVDPRNTKIYYCIYTVIREMEPH